MCRNVFFLLQELMEVDHMTNSNQVGMRLLLSVLEHVMIISTNISTVKIKSLRGKTKVQSFQKITCIGNKEEI